MAATVPAGMGIATVPKGTGIAATVPAGTVLPKKNDELIFR